MLSEYTLQMLFVKQDAACEMSSYGLRRRIRGPKKYGETTKERIHMLAPSHLDVLSEQKEVDCAERKLDDRYIRNAAIVPELYVTFREKAQSDSNSVSVHQPDPGPSLTIHGFTVAEYQQMYHSVVDPLLLSPSGKLKTYSVELGRAIKEHLFTELAYPTIQISEQSTGKVEVLERFCLLRSTPHIDVDCNGHLP
uniref:uncharacterized protein C22orf31-like n=1 Tax=Doryrhamphus excisus TaxID=161450 RepID=UPI0025AE6C7E|nr:uncharacterized protein C22orf31-like [Doryrhamphus excisus]XP_057936294.1 uncharacterized protein C22orf31-like [Doryrhamphus excisus]